MARTARIFVRIAAATIPAGFAMAAAVAPRTSPPPLFQPMERAVNTWRDEAAGHLVLTPGQIVALLQAGATPQVARCVKLNNYWCIKKAGWEGELAADNEGHVAFGSAVEGAAVAALLLKRYYVDFGRKTAMSIVSHWAPAQCGLGAGAGSIPRRPTPAPALHGLGNTLRARWLAAHTRGFVTPAKRGAPAKRSVVADRTPRPMATPTIAVGLGEVSKPTTLDALMMSSRTAPPSRSMIGMTRGQTAGVVFSLSTCSGDQARIAAYAAKAAIGLAVAPGGDLALFDADGKPTPNLAIVMANMARVEIGPLGPTPALIEAGITAAFRPGRNPDSKSAPVPAAGIEPATP